MANLLSETSDIQRSVKSRGRINWYPENLSTVNIRNHNLCCSLLITKSALKFASRKVCWKSGLLSPCYITHQNWEIHEFNLFHYLRSRISREYLFSFSQQWLLVIDLNPYSCRAYKREGGIPWPGRKGLANRKFVECMNLWCALHFCMFKYETQAAKAGFINLIPNGCGNLRKSLQEHRYQKY